MNELSKCDTAPRKMTKSTILVLPKEIEIQMVHPKSELKKSIAFNQEQYSQQKPSEHKRYVGEPKHGPGDMGTGSDDHQCFC